MNKLLRYLIFALLIAGVGYAIYFYMNKPAKVEVVEIKTEEVKKVAELDENGVEVERVAEGTEEGTEDQAVTQVETEVVEATEGSEKPTE